MNEIFRLRVTNINQSISQSINQSEFVHINIYIQPVIFENKTTNKLCMQPR